MGGRCARLYCSCHADCERVGVLMAAAVWAATNALLWYCLLELSPFKRFPPVPVSVAGIFANFYLIPLARRLETLSPISRAACQ